MIRKILIKENPDSIYDANYNKIAAWTHNDAYAFGMLDNKIYVSEVGSTHNNIAATYMDIDYDLYKSIKRFGRNQYKYAGRIWIDDHIISFWEFPNPSMLKKIINLLEKEMKEVHNKKIKIDNDWSVDIPLEITKKNGEVKIKSSDKWYDVGCSFSALIPVNEYSKYFKKNLQYKAIEHILSPLFKNKKVPIEFVKKQWMGGLSPTQRHQLVYTSDWYIPKLKELIESITIPVEIGDEIKVGKFKNKPIKVKSIEYDEDGLPIINGRKACTFKLGKKKPNIFDETIQKSGNKWVVKSKDGEKTLGTHDTKDDALKQLRAIEINKNK